MAESLKRPNLDHWDSKDSFSKDELAYLLLDLEPQYEGSHPKIVERIMEIIQTSKTIFNIKNDDLVVFRSYPREKIQEWAKRGGILDLIPFLQTREQRNKTKKLAQDIGLIHHDDQVFIHEGSAIKILNHLLTFSLPIAPVLIDTTPSTNSYATPVSLPPFPSTAKSQLFRLSDPLESPMPLPLNLVNPNNFLIKESAPTVFPRLEIKKPDQKTHKAKKGVTVTLPHMTKPLEVVFKVMWQYWGEYDPQKKVPTNTQANVITDIEEGLTKANGTSQAAERDAKVFAKNIQPDPIRKITPQTRKVKKGNVPPDPNNQAS